MDRSRGFACSLAAWVCGKRWGRPNPHIASGRGSCGAN